ncbi:MAG: GSCFA domain-containing protein, partial [Flavobacteriia bacterium]|nr:GSCFA domain-containing protein [Flavobacteriia bacterium]
MDYTISFPIKKATFSIQHEDEIILLGSCFSDEISKKFNHHGFNTFSNPFGTIFHPLMLSSFINNCLQELKKERVLQKENLYLSWDASSTFFEYDEPIFLTKLKNTRQ